MYKRQLLKCIQDDTNYFDETNAEDQPYYYQYQTYKSQVAQKTFDLSLIHILRCPALRKPPHELAALYVGRGHYHRPCGDGRGAFRRAGLEQRLPVYCPVPNCTFCRAFLQPAPVA